MTEALTNTQRRQLKAAAHHLKPVVTVGDAGLSEAFYAEAEVAINHHELIKIKLPATDRDAREALVNELCARLGAALVQRIGRTATLYRKSPED